ncbi:MAG: cell envelope biogenesis protein TolA [Myxococcales bacterium]|nr:cell envelope biogenesis protein TolA [Myxococcales bacterium]
MTAALIIVSVLLVASLAWQLFGTRAAGPAPARTDALERERQDRLHAEGELEKRRKELDEHRAALAEAKEQLKQAKRKLYEQKEATKSDLDLAKAREATERSASTQLESARAELATALAELQKLKAEAESRGRRPASVAAMAPIQVPPSAPAVQKVVRELNEAEKEKMQRLEHQSQKDRARSGELDREVKRLRGRLETEKRVYTVTKGELDLVKDKFKALEKRLNRTLLERDLSQRAIADLQKKTGHTAERTELSAEELAASDRAVEERQLAEAKAAEERVQRLAAEAKAAEEPVPADEPKPPEPTAPTA